MQNGAKGRNRMFETILAGVTVFILGQIFLKLVIDPVHNLKKAIADIAHALINHAHIYSNAEVVSDEEAKRVYLHLRSLASSLNASYYMVPLYKFTRMPFCLPQDDSIHKSSKNLVALANWMHSKNEKRHEWRQNLRQDISEQLRIYMHESEKVDSELLESAIHGNENA